MHVYIVISFHFRALINRAGGLYGRILTSVVCTDLTAFVLYPRPRSRFSHTDRLSSVNKMFIIWQTRKIYIVVYHWFVQTDILLANGDELNLNLPKFFSRQAFLAHLLVFLEEKGQYFLHFSLQRLLFHRKMQPV